tara:strand:+ start:6017 stop:6943 length:927 start_codon:yes stop_codon:yes gene_type:complete
MRINIFIIVIFFIFNSFNEAFSNISNKIIVKVENQIVTNYEIKNKILRTLLLSGQNINQENINNLKKQALDFMVQQKLKKIQIIKYNVTVDENQINSYLNSISSNNIIELKNRFKNNNIDFDLYLNEIKIFFKWQKLIYQIYSNKIEIDNTNIDQELDDLINKRSEIKEFKLSEIEILRDDEKSNLKKIEEIKNELKINNFSSVAAKFSMSTSSTKKGNLGWINSSSLSKEIYNKLNVLKPGEITDPIFRQNSILFLQLNDRRTSSASNIDITQLRNNLINQKKNELFTLYSRSHLSKLRNTSTIEYK